MFETDPKEAILRYKNTNFQVLSPGTFVRCAVTGKAISLDDLKYWSVKRQEAYFDAQALSIREHEIAKRES